MCSHVVGAFKTRPLVFAMSMISSSLIYAEDVKTDQVQLDKITLQAEDATGVTEGSESYTAKSTNTSTKLNLSLRETPQSVKVLTREYLDDTNTNSFQEMLNSVTGVTTNRTDERQYPTARGFDIDYYLFDGVPSSSELDIANDPDLSMYDRVEVVKGANGLMTGAGNPAVAINLIRKHANSKQLTGSLSTSYGSWNAWNSSADVSTPLNNDGSVRGRAVIKHENTDSFANIYEKENNLIYGVIDADITENTYLSVGASYQNLERSGIKWGGLPAFYDDGSLTDFSRKLSVTSDWTYWNTDTKTAFLQLKQNLFNDITFNINYDYREIDADTALLYLWSNSVNKQTNSSAGLYPYTDTSKNVQNNADAYISVPFILGGLKQEVVAGFMFNENKKTDRYYGNPILDSYVIDFNNFNSVSILGSIDNNISSPSNKTTQTGAYFAGKFTLMEPLKLVAGVRISNWEYESEDGDGNRKFNNEITPYAGLIFDFIDNYSWYASYTGIFKPEDKRDINGQFLDPREGKSYETGLKGEFFNNQLNASVSVFQTNQDNVAEKTGEIITVNGTPTDAYRSADGVESKGFELELDGKLNPNWDISFGVAHFNAEDASGTKVKTTSARTTANLFTKYTLDRWSFGGGLNYKSRVYEGEDAARITQDDYILANLMAAYQVDKNIKLQLNLNNLFDEKYYEGIGVNSMVYGAPRNATITFRYNF
ncbi:TonB-dependent siderophore receptor [Acinetobacter guerrae]|uniref:TonB-dependent siderophore receptor n=1 Tax=Acinetobacter guerrae TaxID=1843371 RepID=A0A3A8EQ57_9GAMM|nr:TonB-dependent siderophore receptor [Acinetobacter guerrae]RKG32870.1 TonB-dependent siderophore receptor [Acinetobacter guerrae]